MAKVRDLAIECLKVTRKRLGHPTGEFAEFMAADKMGLTLEAQNNAGFDARRANGERIQVKGYWLHEYKKNGSPNDNGKKMGKIRASNEFDSVMQQAIAAGAEEIEEIYNAAEARLR